MQDQEPEHPCKGVPVIQGVPIFESTIPQALLGKLSKEQQALFALVSKIEQAQAWGNQNLANHNRAIHRLCKSTDSLDHKITFWTARYGWMFWVAGVVSSAILLKVVGRAFDMVVK